MSGRKRPDYSPFTVIQAYSFMFLTRKHSIVLAGAALGLLMFGITGCMTEPHENFSNIMNWLIGQSADGRKEYQPGYLGYAKETKELQNGNTEYVFNINWENEICLYALEVDKNTRKFVGWRYVSHQNACVVPP